MTARPTAEGSAHYARSTVGDVEPAPFRVAALGHDRHRSLSVRSTVGRLWSFGGVSGLGWCLDMAVFAMLVHLARLPAGPANAVSAALAVVFVFLMTHERLFQGSHRQRHRNLAIYVGCQVVLVAGAAWLIGALVELSGLEPLVVKIGITPLTFAANFVVMSAITAGDRAVSGPSPSEGSPEPEGVR